MICLMIEMREGRYNKNENAINHLEKVCVYK